MSLYVTGFISEHDDITKRYNYRKVQVYLLLDNTYIYKKKVELLVNVYNKTDGIPRVQGGDGRFLGFHKTIRKRRYILIINLFLKAVLMMQRER